MTNRKSWLAAMLCAAALSACGGSDSSVESTDGDTVDLVASADATAVDEATPSTAEPAAEAASGTPVEANEGDDEREHALAVPAPNAPTAVGYGRQVTGGAGPGTQRVRVTNTVDLARELCRQVVGGRCTDDAPRIIEVATTISFIGTEKTAPVMACNYSSCGSPWKPERLAVMPNVTHCKDQNLPTFQISYDKAGAESMLVGSNKTLIGVGSAGVIKGKGLMLASGVSNIIIRNLTFSDINAGIIFAGDAIRLGNTDRVWIDHNRFVRIGRQMLVSGWQGGAASNVTVSWNEFDGRTEFPYKCDGKGNHYWNVLLVGKGDSMTFASNWIHDFSGRGPDIHGTNQVVHLVNNYFQDGSGYAVDAGATSTVLMEGNYFKSVKQPIIKNGSHGYVFAPLAPTSSATTSRCSSALKRNCVPNVADPMPQTNNFTLDAAVPNAMKSAPAGAIAIPYGASKVPVLVPRQAGPGHLGSSS
jgi:pectin lyase